MGFGTPPKKTTSIDPGFTRRGPEALLGDVSASVDMWATCRRFPKRGSWGSRFTTSGHIYPVFGVMTGIG